MNAEVEYGGDLDSSRSEMALLPRRCPRLLLIQIPTSSVLGPFCIFLRSPQPLCYSVLTSLAWSTWRTGATLSLLLARDFRACLFLPFHLAASFSRSNRHPTPRFPTGSFSVPLDNDRSWNTMNNNGRRGQSCQPRSMIDGIGPITDLRQVNDVCIFTRDTLLYVTRDHKIQRFLRHSLF